MISKELKHLSRRELVDIIYQLKKNEEKKQEEISAPQDHWECEVQSLVKKGYGKKQVAETAGIHPFVAGKYMDQCRNFTKAELCGIMEDAADLEESVKTGRLNDTMSVEIFIIKYSYR